MKKLPKSLKKYFWEVDFKNLSPKENPHYVIERLLEYGDINAIKWLKQNFAKEEIAKTIYKSRNLSEKSANFWQIIFNLDRSKILCLKKSFQKKRKVFWNL